MISIPLLLTSLSLFYIISRTALVFAERSVPPHLNDGPKEPPSEEEELKATRGSDPSALWTARENGLVTVPYYIPQLKFNEPYGFDKNGKNLIESSLTEIANESHALHFRPWTSSDNDYILFRKSSSGCSSSVGKQGGYQTIWLSSSCVYTGTIQHEVLHALGFQHEQSRPDRSKYVTIKWKNIKPSWKGQFSKSSSVRSLGAPYDYLSVMHYSAWAASRNGRKTIVAKDTQYIKKLGQRNRISRGDVLQLQLLYQCSSGARPLKKKNRYPCSKKCKCGAGQAGCTRNNSCRGTLSCEQNVCKVKGTSISTSKSTYSSGEDVNITFNNPGKDRIWIAIYPASSNPQDLAEKNAGWSWPCGTTTCSRQNLSAGSFNISVSPGTYRVFLIVDMWWPYESVAYSNSFTVAS